QRPSQIWIVTAARTADAKVQPRQLASGRFDEGNIVWSKDGTQIYFTSLRVDEPYYELPKTELYWINPNGGNATKLNSIDMGIDALSLSPDGKKIAFIAATTQPVNSYTQPDLWVVDLSPNAKPRNLTATFDFDVGDGVFGDSAAPRAAGTNIPLWTADGRSLIEVYGKEGKTILASFDVERSAETDLTHGNQSVLRFCAPSDRSKIVYTLSSPTRINDLFISDRIGGEPRQLTHVNDALFSQLNLTDPE